MKRALLVSLAVGFAPAHAGAEDLALVGGDVYPVSGAPIPGGTVVIRGEEIVAVGLDVPVPPGAQVIDCRGKRVTPGLVESDSSLGLVEVELEKSTVDAEPSGRPVRAALRASDAVDLRSTLVAVARRHGVTSAVSVPRGGLISGQSAWLDLVGPRSLHLERAVQGEVALHASLGQSGAGAVQGSRAAAALLLREVLDDARTYRRNKAAFQRNALYDLAASRLDLEALEPYLDGKRTVVLAVSRAADITAALALARQEKLRVALIGVEEGWLVADALAAAQVPVIVSPLADLPVRFEARNARADNAALLARAGVRVAIATRTSHNAGNLRFYLGNAVRAGLSPELALRAATLVPAEVFGVAARYGTLERGKVANVVVWSGDPFEPSSFAEQVIIRGELQPTESRQTRLARRHLRRLGLSTPGPREGE